MSGRLFEGPSAVRSPEQQAQDERNERNRRDREAGQARLKRIEATQNPLLEAPANSEQARTDRAATLNSNARRRHRMAIALQMNDPAAADPEREARIQTIQGAFPFPREAIVYGKNLEALEALHERGVHDPQEIMDRSPGFAKWIQDGNNGALVVDDVANLSGVEWALKGFYAAASKTGVRQIEAGLRGFAQIHPAFRSGGGAIGEHNEKRLRDFEDFYANRYYGESGFWQESLVEAGKMMPLMLGSMASGATSALILGQLPPLIGLPEEIATVPLGAIGAAAGSFVFVGATEAGFARRELAAMQRLNGDTLETGTINALALSVGAANGALELLSLGRISKLIPGGRQAMLKLGISKISKALETRGFRAALRQFGKDYAGGVGVETVTEVMQELTVIMAKEARRKIDGGEWRADNGVFSMQNIEDLWDVALKTFGATVVLGGLGSPGKVYLDSRESNRVARHAAIYQAAANAIGKTKLLERHRGKAEEAVRMMGAEPGTVDTFFIPVKEFTRIAVELGSDPIEMAEYLLDGDTEQYRDALSKGADLVIPAEKFLTRVVDRNAIDKFSQHVRLNQDTPTIAEMNERHEEDTVLVTDTLKRDIDTFTEDERYIYDQEFKKVLGNRGHVDEADAAARTWVAVMTTSARRVGVTPRELSDSYNVSITRERSTQGGHALNFLKDIPPQTLQLLKDGDEGAIEEVAQQMAAQLQVDQTFVPAEDKDGINAKVVQRIREILQERDDVQLGQAPAVKLKQITQEVGHEMEDEDDPSASMRTTYEVEVAGNTLDLVVLTEGDTMTIEAIFPREAMTTGQERLTREMRPNLTRANIGPRLMREIVRQVLIDFPEIQFIGGNRITGSRAGKAAAGEMIPTGTPTRVKISRAMRDQADSEEAFERSQIAPVPTDLKDQLSFDFEIDEVSAANGAQEAAEQAVEGLDQNLGEAIIPTGKLNRLGSGAVNLFRRIRDGFKDPGYVDLRGEVIETAEDLIVLGRVFRDPRFETSRIVYVDAAGKIKATEAVSARMPAITALFPSRKRVAPDSASFPEMLADKKKDKVDFDRGVEDVIDRMKRLGAVKIWQMHNHPSGIPVSSGPDVMSTVHFLSELGVRTAMALSKDAEAVAALTAEQRTDLKIASRLFEITGFDRYAAFGAYLNIDSIDEVKRTIAASGSLPTTSTLVRMNAAEAVISLMNQGVLPSVAGHVILDHDQFSKMMPSMGFHPQDHQDQRAVFAERGIALEENDPLIKTPAETRKEVAGADFILNNPQWVAEMGRTLAAPKGSVLLVMANSQGRAQSIDYIPLELFLNAEAMGELVKNRARSESGVRAFVYTEDIHILDDLIDANTMKGFMETARLSDVVMDKRDEDQFASAAKMGFGAAEIFGDRESKKSTVRVFEQRVAIDVIRDTGQRIADTGADRYLAYAQRESEPVVQGLDPENETPLTDKQEARVRKAAEDVPGLRKILPHLTAAEKKKVTSKMAGRLAELFGTLRPDELASVAFSGRVKRGWYKNSADAIVSIFGTTDAPRFAALLGALSPRNGVETNLLNALNVWRTWIERGRSTERDEFMAVMRDSVQVTLPENATMKVLRDKIRTANRRFGQSFNEGTRDEMIAQLQTMDEGQYREMSVLGAWFSNALRAVQAVDPSVVTLSGPKANSFMLNLRHFVNEVTLDAHMQNLSGWTDRNVLSGRKGVGPEPGKRAGYLAYSAAVRNAAKILTTRTGETWTPAEVQETVWSWVYVLTQKIKAKGETRRAVEILAAGGLTHEDIAKAPDFATLFQDGVYRRIVEELPDGTSRIKRLRKDQGRRREDDQGDRPRGTATAPEGAGVAEGSFQADLRRAARRLEAVVRPDKQPRRRYEVSPEGRVKDNGKGYDVRDSNAAADRGKGPQGVGRRRGGTGNREGLRAAIRSAATHPGKVQRIGNARVVGQLPNPDLGVYIIEADSAGRREYARRLADAHEANPHGKSVTPKTAEELKGALLVMNEDGTVGVALTEDNDFVAVFRHPKGPKGAGIELFATVLQQARSQDPLAAASITADSYETVLPGYYVKLGLKPVARVKWNDDFAPEGWDPNPFRNWNDGKPDIVLYRFDPEGEHTWTKKDQEAVPTFETWDEAQAKRDKEVEDNTPIVLFQEAYHAGPTDHDAFVLDFVGTGEGVQAFGWGFYFADTERVARSYLVPSVTYRGKRLNGRFMPLSVDRTEADSVLADGIIQTVFRRPMLASLNLKAVSPEAIIEEFEAGLEEEVAEWTENLERLKGELDRAEPGVTGDELRRRPSLPPTQRLQRHVIENIERQLRVASTIEADQIKFSPGQLFKVEIPENDKLLQWDVPVSDDPVLQTLLKKQPLLAGPMVEHTQPVEGKMTTGLFPEFLRTLFMQEPTVADWYGHLSRSLRKVTTSDLPVNDTHEMMLDAVRGQNEALDETMYRDEEDQLLSRFLATEGIPGHRFLDGFSRGAAAAAPLGGARGGKATYNYVIYSDDAVAIQEKFFQGTLDKPNGTIVFSPGGRTFNIKLFEGANESTVFHESAHFYMELLGDLAADPAAHPDIVRDYKIMLRWLSQKTKTTLRTRDDVRKHQAAMSKAGTPELGAMEIFAQGFERYLWEGQAPTVGLADVFAKVRTWMIRIYGKVADLVEIDDHIRGVFDRMIASEQEITAARAQANLMPIEALRESMTEAEFTEYMRLAGLASEEDRAELQRLLLEPEKRQLEDWYQATKARLMLETAAEFDGSPVMRALRFLQHGTMEDVAELPEALVDSEGRPLRLHRKELVKLIGRAGLKELPQPWIYTDKKGSWMSLEDAQLAFGFRTIDQMVEALRNEKSYEKSLLEAVDQKLKARFGDLLEERSKLAEVALDAVSNDRRVSQLLIELRAMRRRLPGGIEQDKRPTFDKARLKAKVREIISGTKVGAIRAHVYMRQMQKFGRLAFERMEKNDPIGAYDAKFNQLLNLMQYREARDATKEAQTIQRFMERLRKPAAREVIGKAGMLEEGSDTYYLDAVDGILNSITTSKASQKQLAKNDKLRAWVQERMAAGDPIAVPESILARAHTTHISELTMLELREIKDTLANLERLARLKTTIKTLRARRDFDEVKAELLETLFVNFESKGTHRKSARSFGDGLREAGEAVDAWLLRPETQQLFIDGGDPNGPWATHIFQVMAQAEADERDIMSGVDGEPGVVRKLVDAFENLTPKQLRRLEQDEVYIESLGVKFTRHRMLMVAANAGSDSNLQRVIDGGQRDAPGPNVNSRGFLIGWNEKAVQEILGHLSREDWAMVQGIWGTLESIWPKIAKMERELTDVVPEKIPPRTWVQTLPDGNTLRINGGYFPLNYETATIPQKGDFDNKSLATLYNHRATRAMTMTGHLIKREARFDRPVDISSMNVIARHLVDAVHDLTHREAVLSVHRLLRDDDIWFSLQDRIGKQKAQEMVLWIERIATNSNGTAKNHIERYAGRFRMNATIAIMGFKTSIWAQNIANYFNALEVVRPNHLVRAMFDFMTDYKSKLALVLNLSGEMRHRFESFDRDVRNNLMDLQLTHHNRLRKRVSEMAFYLMQKTDAMVAYPMWLGMYRQETLRYMGEGKTEARAKELAVQSANSAVRLGLGSGSIKDIAPVQAGGEWLKWGTMFYSWFSMTYSKNRHLGRDTGKASKAGLLLSPRVIAGLLGRYLALVAGPAILSEILSGRGPDDDEDWATWALVKTTVYPFMGIPGVRDAAGMLEARIVEGRRGDRAGIVSALSKDLSKAAEGWIEIIEGEEPSPAQAVKDTAKVFGKLSGLPVSQFEISGGYIEDLATGDEAPEDVIDFIWDFLYRRKEEEPPLSSRRRRR